MVFSSMIFVFCFLFLCLLSHNLCKSIKAKNVCLLVFSLIFYSWAGLGFTVIMLADVLITWIFALLIGRTAGGARRALFFVSVALVLGVLGFFKYTGFVYENLGALFGVAAPEFVSSIALPLGISFYTFQLISYTADVYRGEVKPQKKFHILLLYACLFHQCVAGPIIRYSDIERELTRRKVTAASTSIGISRFSVGLAKKAVLANSCAAIADTYFKGDAAALAAVPAAGLWLAGAAYMLEIYLDFSAYSDMAIGMGLMCGFHYRENFNYPYIADSVTDFWRRWHISLSSFFRDYVYIPLGGNRCGRGRQLFNLFAVWALTGLWHGASWNYVIWGLYFFVFLAVEKFAIGERLYTIPSALRRAAVLAIVYFSWIIFRFEDMGELSAVLRGMFGGGEGGGSALAVALDLRANIFLLIISAVAVTPLFSRAYGALRRRVQAVCGDGSNVGGAALTAVFGIFEVAHPVLLLVLSATALAGNSYNPFLYFIF